MTSNKHLLMFISAVGLMSLLSACGGSSNSSKTPGTSPAPVAANEFLLLAKDTSCANLKNRMYIIDQKQVFWDKAGNCADASFSQTLYGNTPQNIICSNADSIAGPRNSCNDASQLNLFKTILANLDKADLGLGNAHSVQAMAVAPRASSNLTISSFAANLFHGNAPNNFVTNDSAAFTKLMEQGQFKAPFKLDVLAPGQMVLASFYKTPHNCSTTQILKVSSDSQILTAEYFEQERISIASCDTTGNQTSTPMNIVQTQRLDLPVRFLNVSSKMTAYKLVDNSNLSRINSARNVVVKDQQSWSSLWMEHNGDFNAMPVVDFSKDMVLAVFLGAQASGCYGIADFNVWQEPGAIHVAHHDSTPGIGVMCTTYVPTPAYLVSIPRSDAPVDFNAITIYN